MPAIDEIVVLLSCPADADPAAERVRRALEDEWRREVGLLRGLRVRTEHWREDSTKSWSMRGGGQACVNDSLLGPCQLVIAIFDKDKGSPWTDPESGMEYVSGTVAEIRLGHAAGKPVRLYLSAGETGSAEGPSERDPELRAIVRLLAAELGLKTQPWRDLEDLAKWVRQDLTSDIRDNQIKLDWIVVPGRLGLVTDEPIMPRRIHPVPKNYQHREIQDQVMRAWTDGANQEPPTSLVSIVGGGGSGKSFIARDIARQARVPDRGSPAELLLWVDATSRTSTISAYAEAAQQIGLQIPEEAPDRDQRLADKLIARLQEVWWPWLIVLDDADVDELTRHDLMPPTQSIVGRVLVTTRQRHPWLEEYGDIVECGRFEAAEAKRFVQSSHARFADAGAEADVEQLCQALGYLPLALSIAVATIKADHSTIPAWLADFNSGAQLDSVMSEPDSHGYPLMMSQVTQMALSRAARDMPPGVVERAAAVAALLDPMGHRATVWQHPAVQQWIGQGEALEVHRGCPKVLRRLEFFSLAELDDATWPDTTVRMHDMTARAVLEAWSDSGDQLDDLARALVIGLTDPLPRDLPTARLALRNVSRLIGRHLDHQLTGNEVRQVLDLLGRVTALGAPQLSLQACQTLIERAGASLPPTDPAFLDARYELAHITADTGRSDLAVAMFEQLVELRGQVEGPSAPGTLLARARLANSKRILGFTGEDRISELRQIVAQWAEVEPIPNRRNLRARRCLCNALSQAGRTGEALALWAEILRDSVRHLGEEHNDTLIARNSLGLLLAHVQRYSEAVAEFEVLASDRAKFWGENHPGTLVSRSNLGQYLFMTGQTERGLSLLRDCLETRLATFGPDSTNTLTIQAVMSRRLRHLGRIHESLEMADLALAGRTRVHGPGHPAVRTRLRSRALVLLESGQLRQALQVCDSSLDNPAEPHSADREPTEHSPAEHSSAVPLSARFHYTRALCLWALGDLTQAKTHLDAALDKLRQTFDPNHRQVMRTRVALARLSGDLESPEQAVEALTVLATETGTRLGLEHPASLRIRSALAHWTGRNGQVNQAIAMLQDVIETERGSFDQPHRFTLDALQDQARWLGQSGSPQDAAIQLRQVLADRLATMDHDHPQVYETRADLAEWTAHCGDTDQARAMAIDLLADCQATLDPVHPLIRRVEALVARLGDQPSDPIQATGVYSVQR
ncbi:MAG: tetratricopeptide repeat protein [Bifidobacteriaceae bacterium]|jgi:tetratricopeptide (TPR) repeat protein|nr:tetratricopeptide repeat protein [Bifidobacteriaceae bacterium]